MRCLCIQAIRPPDLEIFFQKVGIEGGHIYEYHITEPTFPRVRPARYIIQTAIARPSLTQTTFEQNFIDLEEYRADQIETILGN